MYVNYGYKVEAVFFAWVVQMQLIEYFLWENQSCNTVNIVTTKLGVIVNHLEPVVLWVAILLLSTKQLPHWVNIMMTGFLIITIFYTKYILDGSNDDFNKCTKVTPRSNPHLEWQWNEFKYDSIYYPFFILCLSLLAVNGVEYGNNLTVFILFSFTISFIIYENKKSTGAMWCFLAAFGPWILPYLNQIDFKKLI
jgi:hypothetical protein